MTAPALFRAIWPVLDPSRLLQDLIAEASQDLPRVALMAHAEITGRGRWSMRPAAEVPGSGNVTATVLMYEAPARERPRTWVTAGLTTVEQVAS